MAGLRERVSWRWETGVLDRWDRVRERIAWRWQTGVLDPRDRLRERVAWRWQTGLLDRRDRLRERVAWRWQSTVTTRRDGLHVRLTDGWTEPARVSSRLTVLLVMTAALAGSWLALVAGSRDAGHEPARAGEPPPTRAGPAAAFDSRVRQAIRVLGEERRVARRRLAVSGTARGQAAAAAEVAAAYRSGAAALASTAVRDDPAGTAVLRALRRAAAAYRALAGAARLGDVRRFDAARERIARAEATVRRRIESAR
jgi:hypothetical protein